MSLYFDFKTINKFTGDNSYREQKEFTLNELSKYNGRNGNPAYIAIEGIVYDVSHEPTWLGEKDIGITAGEDLTEQFNYCYAMDEILTNAPKIGVLAEDSAMNFGSNRCANRQVKQNTSNFKPDDWIRYIDPLVNYAMNESNQQGADARRAYQKYMLLGVLVGLGKTPQESIKQVQEWQTIGASQLLKGTGSTTGFGGTGAGTTAGAAGGAGSGFGGIGTGTAGGSSGIGGTSGAGTGTGVTGGTTGGAGGGFGGIGTGMIGGTSGGLGNLGTGTGTAGGFVPGAGTTGTTGGTSGGFGGFVPGAGTTGGTSGGFGSFGSGTGTTGGTTSREVESTEDTDRRDRLYFN